MQHLCWLMQRQLTLLARQPLMSGFRWDSRGLATEGSCYMQLLSDLTHAGAAQQSG
jgi:hypothetical protein